MLSTGTRNVAADGVAVVQALAQAGDEPPVRAVVVHLDLLPDDALFLGDGLLGKVGAVPTMPSSTSRLSSNCSVAVKR